MPDNPNPSTLDDEGKGPPQVNIGDIMSLWCNRHWKPFHGKAGPATAASLEMVKRVLELPKFMRRCGWNPATGAVADVEQINHELTHVKPLCCYLGDRVMADIRQMIRAEGGDV